jgi:hypothetical protein
MMTQKTPEQSKNNDGVRNSQNESLNSGSSAQTPTLSWCRFKSIAGDVNNGSPGVPTYFVQTKNMGDEL